MSKCAIPPRFWLPADFFEDPEAWGLCHMTEELADRTNWYGDETDQHELVECIRADLRAAEAKALADRLRMFRREATTLVDLQTLDDLLTFLRRDLP